MYINIVFTHINTKISSKLHRLLSQAGYIFVAVILCMWVGVGRREGRKEGYRIRVNNTLCSVCSRTCDSLEFKENSLKVIEL